MPVQVLTAAALGTPHPGQPSQQQRRKIKSIDLGSTSAGILLCLQVGATTRRQGRTAIRQAATPARRKAQHRHHALGLEHTKAYLRDEKFHRPAQSHPRKCLWQGLQLTGREQRFHPCGCWTRSGMRGAKSRRWCWIPTRPAARTMISNPSPLLGTRTDLEQPDSHPLTSPCTDAKSRSQFTTRVVRPTIRPPSASRAPTIPPPSYSRWTHPGRQLAVYDPTTKVFTPIDTYYATHHLQFDAQDRVWTSGGGPG